MTVKIKEDLTNILIKEYDIPSEQIGECFTLTEELGLSSIDIVKLIVCIEDHFNIEFNDWDMRLENFKELNGIVEMIERNLTSQNLA